MTPDSSPYDITPIPQFAFIPSLHHWLAALGFLALVFFVGFCLARRGRGDSGIAPCAYALGELMALRPDSRRALSKDELTRISLILKRLLARFLDLPLAQYSAGELKELTGTALSPAMREIVAKIIFIDTFKFQPESQERPASDFLSELSALVEKLESEQRASVT